MATDGSSYTVRQMTVEEAAEEIDAIVAVEAAQRRGPIPPLTVSDDDGTSYARFRADMDRAQALGLVSADLEGATIIRITQVWEGKT